jgi:hypothetical protein
MPFLTLQNTSNLAQYYNSTVNGTFAGTVNNPNVTFSPKPEVPKSSDQFTLSDEGLIRGGVKNVALAVVKDEKRVFDFLKSDKGKLWAVKQLGLQRSNPLLEYPINVNSFKTSKSTAEITQTTRIYNLGLNTLASVGGNAFGLHFDRHGLIPVNTYNYEKIATENNKNQRNRLEGYLGDLIINNNYETGRPITLQSYSSGPNSPYGLGITRIDTAPTIRPKAIGSTDLLRKFFIAKPIADSPAKNDNLQKQLTDSILPYNNNIAGYNIEQRIGVSRSGSIDSINAINITDSVTFYNNSNAQKSSFDVLGITDVDGKYGRDIIKFRIEFLNNDNPTALTTVGDNQVSVINTNVLAFRAYLDDFNDGMTAKWDPYRYMGRGEEFYVYNGFTRDISVSFTMYAHSPAEMKPLYSKLNYLMSTFAPDYTSSGKMRGNIGYLTVGDYIYRQPGVFTDIKLSGLLDTHWEIALNEPENGSDKDQYEVPKLIKVGLSFKPIHTFLPRTNYTIDNNKFTSPFITPDKVAYSGYTNNKNKYLD